MKIVIATPILYNDASPFNHLFKDIIGGFLEDGNQIIRLVAVENRKEVDFKYGYTGKNIEYKLFKRKNSNHKNIISRYIRDNITNIREALSVLYLKDVDVLFEDVSYSSFWAIIAAKIKGIKIVTMIQDIWPDNAVQSHLILEGSFLYKFFEMWQRSVYKNADRIICISDDMKAFIAGKGVDDKKIHVIYNWGYSDDSVEIAWDDNEFVKKYGLSKDVFYAIYAGNIGKMQNVEIVVNAAKELRHCNDIQFLIIGEGVRKETIDEMANGLTNVMMLPMQPSQLATHIYSAAGVNIIPLVAGGTKTALPSKTGVVLSCGKPVIVCVDENSHFANMICREANGAAVNPENPVGLAQEIRKLADDHVREYSYNCFKKFFLKNTNVKKYEESIRRI